MEPKEPEILPELESVEAFAESLYDDDRETFTTKELVVLCQALRERDHHKVRVELEGYGVTLEPARVPRRIRGINTSSNDRYFGPGAEKMHGGSGWEQISGFAGQKG